MGRGDPDQATTCSKRWSKCLKIFLASSIIERIKDGPAAARPLVGELQEGVCVLLEIISRYLTPAATSFSKFLTFLTSLESQLPH
jgi:hypothetical protein